MSDANHNIDHKQMMDTLLLAYPSVTSAMMFGYPCYKVDGKTFCIVAKNGIGIKLPAERIKALITDTDAFHDFYPANNKPWKSWMAIDYDDSQDYQQHIDLYEEAMTFASQG